MAAPKAPVGSKSDKIWRDAVMRAVKRMQAGDDVHALERLADKLVSKGLEGDIPAIREIGDRLDGKPHQTAEVTVTRQRASELTDDDLAGIVSDRRSAGTPKTPGDPPRLH